MASSLEQTTAWVGGDTKGRLSVSAQAPDGGRNVRTLTVRSAHPSSRFLSESQAGTLCWTEASTLPKLPSQLLGLRPTISLPLNQWLERAGASDWIHAEVSGSQGSFWDLIGQHEFLPIRSFLCAHSGISPAPRRAPNSNWPLIWRRRDGGLARVSGCGGGAFGMEIPFESCLRDSVGSLVKDAEDSPVAEFKTISLSAAVMGADLV